ncbi:MAG: hypothetical protein U0176_21970 [Bacteroidia bacterium]
MRITRSFPLAPANAGPDFSTCTDTSNLSATPPPAGVGQWTVVSGPGILFNAFLPNTGITGLSTVTPTVFRWTVTNPPCAPVSDDVRVTRLPSPTANAGPDQNICATNTTLNATTPTSGTGTWSLGSGSGTVVTPALTTTAVTNLGIGANVFNWTVTNGVCPDVTDQVLITQFATPTTAAAGPDQNVCGTTAILSANIPSAGTGTWTLVSGTGTIANPGSPTTAISGLSNGPNIFRWTIANGACPNSADDVTITRVALAPPANAGPDQTVCDSFATLSGNVPSPGTGQWIRVLGSGTIVTPSNPVTAVSGLAIGDNYLLDRHRQRLRQQHRRNAHPPQCPADRQCRPRPKRLRQHRHPRSHRSIGRHGHLDHRVRPRHHFQCGIEQ